MLGLAIGAVLLGGVCFFWRRKITRLRVTKKWVVAPGDEVIFGNGTRAVVRSVPSSTCLTVQRMPDGPLP